MKVRALEGASAAGLIRSREGGRGRRTRLMGGRRQWGQAEDTDGRGRRQEGWEGGAGVTVGRAAQDCTSGGWGQVRLVGGWAGWLGRSMGWLCGRYARPACEA